MLLFFLNVLSELRGINKIWDMLSLFLLMEVSSFWQVWHLKRPSFHLRCARPFCYKKKKSYMNSMNVIPVVPAILNLPFQALLIGKLLGMTVGHVGNSHGRFAIELLSYVPSRQAYTSKWLWETFGLTLNTDSEKQWDRATSHPFASG